MTSQTKLWGKLGILQRAAGERGKHPSKPRLQKRALTPKPYTNDGRDQVDAFANLGHLFLATEP